MFPILESLEPRLLLSGTSFVVNTLTDFSDANDTLLTLREAIVAANTNVVNGNIEAGSATEVDVITFDAAALEAEAGVGEPLTITLNGTQLEIADSVDIRGLGENVLSIDGDGLSRVFYISGEETEVQLDGLAITGGAATYNGVSHSAAGGGIRNDRSTLIITNSRVFKNTANDGGGIQNFLGTISISNSTILANSVSGFSSLGGGIDNYSGTLTLINSTVFGNTNPNYAGGIYSRGGSVLKLINSTVTANLGGGISVARSIFILDNSIVALNKGDNSLFTDQLTITNSLIGVDPSFVRNPTAGADGLWGTNDDDYGDLRLKDSSIAINRGDAAFSLDIDGTPLTTDLDGAPRIALGQVDIGAYEYQGSASPLWETPSTVVTTLMDVIDTTDGVISLREAITYASTSQLDITFASELTGGRIILDGHEVSLHKPLNIDASSIGGIIIDAGGLSNVMRINDAEMASLTQLTLTGSSPTGYGLYASYNTLTLTDSSVSDNMGGGIYNVRSVLAINNSSVSDNNGNTGIFNILSTLDITNSTVSGNVSNSSGGGIYTTGTVTITNSSISNNYAKSGGGINSYKGTVILTNTSINGNVADGSGGGINNDGGTITMTNTTLSGNAATGYAGGIYNRNGLGPVELINSTLSANYAALKGGAIYLNAGNITLTNTTVAGNFAGISGAGLYLDDGIATINNSLIVLNGDSNITRVDGDSSIERSLIDIDPGFVRNPSAGPDGVWGTADDDAGDLHLSEASIAINLGNPVLAVDADGLPLTTDLDGNPRIVHSLIDIGAYEYQAEASPAWESPSSTVSVISDAIDKTDGVISLNEALVYSDFLQQDITFAPQLSGATITLNGSELKLSQSVTIDATAIGGITIDANQQSRIMSISSGAVVTLKGVEVTGGFSTDSGGGILNQGTLTLIDSTITNNSSLNHGGGIYNHYGDLTIINSKVSNNLAINAGNGIYNRGYRENIATLSIYGSAITGNASGPTPGSWRYSIYNESANLTVTNSTVAGNPNGGIKSNRGSATINNSIVAFNSGLDTYGISINNSLVGVDPGFVRNPSPGLDGEWGTPDDDFGDLRLRLDPNSLAVDTGDNALLALDTFDLDKDGNTTEPIPFDIAGNARINGANVDIGAYEAVPIVTGIIDVETDDTLDALHAYDFGTVHGAEPGVATFTIRNEGNDTLTVDQAYTFTSLFQVIPANDENTSNDWSIQPGETKEITVNFLSPVAGTYSDTLVLTSDNPYEPVYVITLSGIQTLPSAHYIVDSLLDIVANDGQVTLREAIEAANTNNIVNNDVAPGSPTEADIITFHPDLFADGPATIFLNGAELQISDALTLQGPGSETLTLDANLLSRVLKITGEQTSVDLAGLRITNGLTTENGGGILVDNSTLILTNTLITNNTATTATSIYTGKGGGIYNNYGSITANHLTISENSSQTHGGGIYNNYGSITMDHSTISDNSSQHTGGGITSDYGTITLANSTLFGNIAKSSRGGGYYARYGTLVINNSKIISNRSSLSGGGIHCNNLTLSNSIVSNNFTTGFGGGISAASSNYVAISNSVVSGNSARKEGGGIEIKGPGLILNNSIVSLNSANDRDPDIKGTFTARASITTVAPQFVRNPSPGDDEIWATEDDDFGDLRLRITSPGVNTGDNALLPLDVGDVDGDGDTGEVLPWDLDGGERVHGGVVDMGAYENTEPLPVLAGDFNGDESIDLSDADLISAAIHTGNQNPLFNLNGDEQVDLLDGQLHVTEHLNANPADSNFDGAVNIADLITWAQHYGSGEPVFSEGDTNFDGKVNIADLIQWAQNFGQTGPVAPPAIVAPLVQSSNAITMVPAPVPSDSTDVANNPWAHLKSLINPTSQTSSSGIDIIQNLTPAI